MAAHDTNSGSGPYPVLVQGGEQGTGKSTTSKLLRSIVDPNTSPLRSMPREGRDLYISATNSWVQSFDNISGLLGWLSDALCRLSTGGGLAVRELYSDDEEILLDVKRPIILNGITDFVTRPDLIDRSILVECGRIPDTQRKPESDVTEAFEKAHPKILGALLGIVSAGLRRLPTTRVARLPRMADFALWVTACEEALGWQPESFICEFADARRVMIAAALEEEPIYPALRDLLATAGEWVGNATDLHAKLKELAHLSDAKTLPDGFPKSPKALGSKLKRLAPALRAQAIYVSQARDSANRSWRVSRKDISRGTHSDGEPAPDPEPEKEYSARAENPKEENIMSQTSLLSLSLETRSRWAFRNDVSNDVMGCERENNVITGKNNVIASKTNVIEGEIGLEATADGHFMRRSTTDNDDNADITDVNNDISDIKNDISDIDNVIKKPSENGHCDINDVYDVLFLSPGLLTRALTSSDPPPKTGKKAKKGKKQLITADMPDTARPVVEKLGVEVVYITNPSDAVDAIDALLACPGNNALGLDIETQPNDGYADAKDPYTSQIRLVQLYGGGAKAYVVDLRHLPLSTLSPVLTKSQFVAHNATFEAMHLLQHAGYCPKLHCTQLMSRLCAVDGERHGLRDAVLKHLGLEIDKTLQASDWAAATLTDAQINYAALDAILTHRLKTVLLPRLKQLHQFDAYQRLQPIIQVIAKQRLTGVRIDTTYHRELAVVLDDEQAAAKAHAAAAIPIANLGSPKQLSDWLKTTVRPATLARWPKTAKGNQLKTDEETLARLNDHHQAQAIIPLRGASKRVAMYGPPFLRELSPVTGRAHSDYKILGADTGKFSSSHPNLMQIPQDPRIRRLIIASAGYTLVVADFSQLELRIGAELSQVPALVDAYANDLDIHRRTAAFVYSIPEGKVTKDQRSRAKAVNFGFLYGQSAGGFRVNQIKAGNSYTEAEAQAARSGFFAAYPGLAQWQAEVISDARRSGLIVTGSGRVRALKATIDNTVPVNALVAGTAADILIAALVALDEPLTRCGGRLLFHVHDEIIIEAPTNAADECARVLEQAMLTGFNAVLPDAPTSNLIEAGIGKDWAEAKR